MGHKHIGNNKRREGARSAVYLRSSRKVCFICKGKGTLPSLNSKGAVYRGSKIVDNKCPACNGMGRI